MMSFNIKDYVKVYKNFLDQQTCAELVNKLKEQNWKIHTFYNSQTDTEFTHDKELSVTYAKNLPEAIEVQKNIWYVIKQYIDDNNFEWFRGWNGYSPIRFNRYDVNTRMALHCDHIHSMFDGRMGGIPTLSVLGVLNDDYEGGNLVFWESEEIKLKAGEIIIFPSNFMYPHRVDEVTKGTRYSYVSWVW